MRSYWSLVQTNILNTHCNRFCSVSFCVSQKHTVHSHWSRVTHICVSKLTIIGSDNGLSPCRRQAIIRTNAGILLIGLWGTNCSEILIKINIFSLKQCIWKYRLENGDHYVSAPIWYSCDSFTYILLGYFIGYDNIMGCCYGSVVRVKIYDYQTITKHNNARNICLFLGLCFPYFVTGTRRAQH